MGFHYQLDLWSNRVNVALNALLVTSHIPINILLFNTTLLQSFDSNFVRNNISVLSIVRILNKGKCDHMQDFVSYINSLHHVSSLLKIIHKWQMVWMCFTVLWVRQQLFVNNVGGDTTKELFCQKRFESHICENYNSCFRFVYFYITCFTGCLNVITLFIYTYLQTLIK